MALLLRSAQPVVFMHVQKTGGSWVRVVLKELGLAGGEVGNTHTQMEKVRARHPDAFFFGFVRDPFDFLRSYFSHRYKHGRWHANRDLDQQCKASTFAEFLDLYLAELPEWVSNWYELYVGDADFVGRNENLREDLCSALDLAGVPYVREIILTQPVYNATKPWEVPPEVLDLGTREAYYRDAIRASEARAYARWYPTV